MSDGSLACSWRRELGFEGRAPLIKDIAQKKVLRFNGLSGIKMVDGLVQAPAAGALSMSE